jgi:hypothetical protein
MKRDAISESPQVYVLDPWLDSPTFLPATLWPRTTIPGVVINIEYALRNVSGKKTLTLALSRKRERG